MSNCSWPQQVLQEVLQIPSKVLKLADVNTFREFAALVFRCTQQISHKTYTFENAFLKQEEAQLYAMHVRERINCSIPCTDTEECIVLPPLFLRSAENAIYELSPQLFLVTYKNGPIIPVIRLYNDDVNTKDKDMNCTTVHTKNEEVALNILQQPHNQTMQVCASENNSHQRNLDEEEALIAPEKPESVTNVVKMQKEIELKMATSLSTNSPSTLDEEQKLSSLQDFETDTKPFEKQTEKERLATCKTLASTLYNARKRRWDYDVHCATYGQVNFANMANSAQFINNEVRAALKCVVLMQKKIAEVCDCMTSAICLLENTDSFAKYPTLLNSSTSRAIENLEECSSLLNKSFETFLI